MGDETTVNNESGNTIQDKMSKVLNDDFSPIKTAGGILGIISSILPTIVFISIFIVVANLFIAICGAISIAIFLALINYFVHKSFSQLFFGLTGVIICAFWVWNTGQAKDFFALGILLNIVYMLVFIISMLFRIPIIGLIIEFVLHQSLSWRKNPLKYRTYANVTLLWIFMFALRTVVKVPLYFLSYLTTLAIAHIVLSVPLYVVILYFSWIMLKNTIKN